MSLLNGEFKCFHKNHILTGIVLKNFKGFFFSYILHVGIILVLLYWFGLLVSRFSGFSEAYYI